MSTFSIYIVGYAIFIGGLALAAHLLGVPPVWIGVMILILLGIGIFAGVSRTRRTDPSPEERNVR